MIKVCQALDLVIPLKVLGAELWPLYNGIPSNEPCIGPIALALILQLVGLDFTQDRDIYKGQKTITVTLILHGIET